MIFIIFSGLAILDPDDEPGKSFFSIFHSWANKVVFPRHSTACDTRREHAAPNRHRPPRRRRCSGTHALYYVSRSARAKRIIHRRRRRRQSVVPIARSRVHGRPSSPLDVFLLLLSRVSSSFSFLPRFAITIIVVIYYYHCYCCHRHVIRYTIRYAAVVMLHGTLHENASQNGFHSVPKMSFSNDSPNRRRRRSRAYIFFAITILRKATFLR